MCVSGTAEFHHASITVPQIKPEDKVINSIAKLKNELESIPAPEKDNQIEAMSNLRNLCSKHSKTCDVTNENTYEIPTEFKEISHEHPRVPKIDDATSPKAPELDATPPSKVCKRQENKTKRLSSSK